ncbi:nucleotidyltransferase [Brevibacillus nitrificans]|uniref:nucleotidyltransferase domain-containing protein n=1 Tax=Brevibacillus nitrificans TaxID=651560 RepID=UPI002862E107|nr:nucleotidyltransferase [Brevibacillus nitrificans]MDR7313779.1 hypothetical protein [Brevibacillus nitrificans]
MNTQFDLATVPNQMEDLLQRICGSLQITRSQYEEIERSYGHVAKWLSSDKGILKEVDVDIYPQGSLRIGTTVRPLSQQEYDLDLVCELKLDWGKHDALTVFEAVKQRMLENEMYAPMVEPKKRCVRLNYAGNYHLDILPACPTELSTSNSRVKVPDRSVEDWKDSNPKGFAGWFDRIADDFVPLQYELLEKKAEIQPLPGLEPVEIKPPLKRAVQLIKRYRDVYFENDPDNAPISIVLTRLAADTYNKQGSVAEAIQGILAGIGRLIQDAQRSGNRLKVVNPMNQLEDLSEKWDSDPTGYKYFLKFIYDFHQEWNRVMEIQGIHNVATALKEMFRGKLPIDDELRKQASFMKALRENSKLGVTSSGLLTTSILTNTVPVKGHNFYGSV